MRKKVVAYSGMLGVALFLVSSIIGGLLIEDYSVVSQFISETYAIDTEYGVYLRFLGYIPSGVFIAIFCFLGWKYFQPSMLTKIGFYGLGMFYGLATIIVGLFPCDSGCNKQFIDPSISQVIHNLTGFLTYVFVPVNLLIIGIGLNRLRRFNGLSKLATTCGLLSIFFVVLLFSDSSSKYIGLYQRIVEITFMGWVVACSMTIKKDPMP